MGAAHTRKPLKRLDLNFLIISLKQEIILSHILQIVKTQIYFSINTKRADSCESAQLLRKCYKFKVNYSLIAITAPEPTVLPPSRIAKRRPTSIAIGVISSTSISTLSPGIHISVPSGSEIVPVTSVVLK